jgi:hypothetical protein
MEPPDLPTETLTHNARERPVDCSGSLIGGVCEPAAGLVRRLARPLFLPTASGFGLDECQ